MTGVVTSPHNTRVAAARKLLQHKERVAASAFLAEGPHTVAAALASRRHRVRELFVTPDAASREVDLLRAAATQEVPVVLVSDRALAAVAETRTPQGVVAVVATAADRLDDVLRARPRLLAVLCDVADPGNAGTVIRTADAAGADAVVLAGASVDVHNGKCVRATAGSLFHLPVLAARRPADVVRAVRDAGVTTLATTVDGGDDLDALVDDGTLTAPTAWIFGSEAHGLPADVVAAADRRVRIPVYGAAESLNLAAAAAVCLYASARAQRRAT